MLEGIRELQKKMRKFDGIPVRTEPLFPSRYFLIQKNGTGIGSSYGENSS